MITSRTHLTEQNLAIEMQQIAGRLDLADVSEALYFPKFFQIETVRVCNAKCPFCAIDLWDKSVPFMSDTLFEKIACELEAYAHWIEFVSVQRAGEPLLDKKIASRVRRLHDAGIKRLSLSTNASRLDEKMSVALLEAGLTELMISIDSVHEDSYKKMRVGLDYDSVLNNIQTFFRVRDEMGSNAIVRVRGVSFYDMALPEHRQEVAEWERFWERFKRPDDRIYMKRAHSWGNQKIWDGHTPDYGEIYHPCVLPWSTLHITAMGLVPLCPQDYDATIDLGDINTHSIAEVWRNGRWTQVREQHRRGRREEIALCRGCRLFDLEFSLENWQQKQLYES